MAIEQVYQALNSDTAALAAYQRLSKAGGRVYVVGGAVRDAMLGKKPKDVDLMVTHLDQDQIERALTGPNPHYEGWLKDPETGKPKKIVAPLSDSGVPPDVTVTKYFWPGGSLKFEGKQFGIYRLRMGRGREVEVAMPRTEKSTGPRYQDFEIVADPHITPEEDLYRRDFTANAMALDIDTGQLIDPHGGAADIGERKLSMVNPAAFRDDPVRMIRALVAYARHGLQPDTATLEAMRENAFTLKEEAPERLRDELLKLLSTDRPAVAIELAHETGILAYLLPEVDKAFGFEQNNPYHDLDVGRHTMAVLDHIGKLSNDPEVRLAALLHDIGKPDSYWEDPEKSWVDQDGEEHVRGKFHQHTLPDGTSVGQDHEDVGARQTEAIMKRLRFPNDSVKRVTDLVQNHMFDYFTNERGARRLLNRLSDPQDPKYAPRAMRDLLLLREADSHGKSSREMSAEDQALLAQSKNHVQNVINKQEAFSTKDLAVNGNDLMTTLGMPESPQIGEILKALTNAVIEHPELNNRDSLLEMARGFLPPQT